MTLAEASLNTCSLMTTQQDLMTALESGPQQVITDSWLDSGSGTACKAIVMPVGLAAFICLSQAAVLACICHQERSIDRVYTIVYLPVTFTLVGLVARFPRILWTAKIRIWTAYSFFTLANAAVPLVRKPDGPHCLLIIPCWNSACGSQHH